MLKEIIASILLPALLLQLVGCYSYSEITINELQRFKKDNIKLVTKDSKEYSLFYENKSEENNWKITDSVIYVNSVRYVKSKRLIPYFPNKLLKKVDTAIIPITSIKELYKRSSNLGWTAFIIVIAIVSLIYINAIVPSIVFK